MKALKKFLTLTLCVLASVMLMLSVTACNVVAPPSSDNGAEDNEIRKIYATYVAYAEERGETPLSYEEWLASIKGEKGDQGETGSQGPQGEKGEQGEDGLSAYQIWLANGNSGTQADFLNWLKGQKGDQGEKGDKGDQGEQGETGPQGDKGEQGETGPQGPQGEQGDKGDQGEDGKSAYQIWLENGNTGTEEDFLNWLKGQKGDQGEAGPQGPQGDKGDQGETGPQGPQGEQGDKGDQGETGPQGPQGETGPQGPQGDQGLSAYEVWLSLGYTGTEEDFLNWLKGLNDHDYGDWAVFGSAEAYCEQLIFYRVCSVCNKIELKQGSESDHNWQIVTQQPTCVQKGYHYKTCLNCGKEETEKFSDEVDHVFETTYSYDKFFHWFDCVNCPEIKDKEEHVAGEDGKCTACGYLPTGTEGILYEVDASGEFAFVVGYNGTAKEIKIANTYNGVPVTQIYNEAFYYNDTITSVIIPNSVTTIGEEAFYRCDSLTSVVIGNSVTTIGEYAFEHCSNLQFNEYDNCKYLGSVTNQYYALIGVTATYSTTYTIHSDTVVIAELAFENRNSLTSIEVDANNMAYASIDGNLYNKDCTTLIQYAIGKEDSEFIVPNSVTSIGYAAFSWCNSLTSVVIPDSVTSIGSSAFYWCNLTSVVIPDSVTTIGEEAFYRCSSLTNVVIGDSVFSIGERAFDSCDSLTSVVIGNSVTSIGYGAFAYCYNLTSIVIPDSVTTIGVGAFRGCDSLTSVVIGNSVTTIGSSAFCSCYSLTSIKYGGTQTEWSAISKGDEWNYNTGNYTMTYNYQETHDHIPVVIAAVEPTCTETGLTEGEECLECGKILVEQEIVDALGHHLVLCDIQAPTCTEPGKRDICCDRCGHVAIEGGKIPALGHNVVDGDCTRCEYSECDF